MPASAATLLKQQGYDIAWKDAIAEGWGYERFTDYVKLEAPDILAMETKTPIVRQHWQIITEVKQRNPSTRFVLMGDHVTAFPKESLKECPELDYVITGGDYDFSLLGIADHVSKGTDLPPGIWFRQDGKIASTGDFELTGDLDSLPMIDRDLTKFSLYREFNIKHKPFAYTVAGRDCPYHRCRFCAWTTLYPTFRVRSPESLLDEIGILIDKYGVREIFDDTGTFPSGGWLVRFCNGMIERGYSKKVALSCNFRFDYLQNPAMAKLMKQAGFRLLKTGLESANQKTLDLLDKGIKVEDIVNGCRIAREAKLDIHLTIMVGYPWETRDDALNTLELARHLMTSGLAEVLQATVVVPYPGTPLYQDSIDNGWFSINPTDYDRYDMTEPILVTPDMTPKEVMEICNRIYHNIFLSPGYIVRRLSKIRSLDDIKYHWYGVRAVLGHMKDFTRQQINR